MITEQAQYHSADNQEKLYVLQQNLCNKIEDLLSELDCKFVRNNKMFLGPCPIHGGDNPNGLNLYYKGDTLPGFWRCNTHHCEKTFKKTILGFIRGVLSHQKFNWGELQSQRTVSFKDTIKWCCDFLGVDFNDIVIDKDAAAKRQFIADTSKLANPEEMQHIISRITILPRLDIPAQYFIRRGWSANILKKYDVGLVKNEHSPMKNRVAVPVYDEDYQYIKGFTFRSIYEQCNKCKLYHNPLTNCPDKQYWAQYSKWRNSNFQRDKVLYNLWFAKQSIKQDKIAILVEGPGEIWRLAEANIPYGLGMFGSYLTDHQEIILESSGAMSVIICTNNDKAGEEAKQKLTIQLQRSYKLFYVTPNANDLGTTSIVETQKMFNKILDKAKVKIC